MAVGWFSPAVHSLARGVVFTTGNRCAAVRVPWHFAANIDICTIPEGRGFESRRVHWIFQFT
jgi:hypothetical protein